jgi:hypothetical protein
MKTVDGYDRMISELESVAYKYGFIYESDSFNRKCPFPYPGDTGALETEFIATVRFVRVVREPLSRKNIDLLNEPVLRPGDSR